MTEPRPITAVGRLASSPIHPLLFGAFPVLFLVRINASRTSVVQAAPHLAVTIATIAVLYVTGLALKENKHLFAIRLSIVLIWFFVYGHLALALASTLASIPFKGHVLLFPLWTALFVAVLLLTRRLRDVRAVTRILNGVALVLIVMTLVGLTDRPLAATGDADLLPRVLSSSDPRRADNARRPDVYYLVFDRYAGAESLREYHRFTNATFLDDLRSRGFVIPERTRGNYPNTAMSLASSLSVQYLDELSDTFDPVTGAVDPIFEAVQRNDVAATFQALGYRYVHVGSWWDGTRTSPIADVTVSGYPLSEFTRSYLASTALAPLLDTGVIVETDPDSLHRSIAERQFVELKKIPAMRGPKFVFAHLLMPHPPYVVDRVGRPIDGEPGTVAQRMRAYIEQLLYTNGKIVQVLDAIESAPGEDPIVILQSDEGPNPTYWRRAAADWTRATPKEQRLKFRIFNALLLPGVDSEKIYPTISPVNTFRLVMSEYFGGRLPLLADTSYVSSKRRPFDFQEMTTQLYGTAPDPRRRAAED